MIVARDYNSSKSSQPYWVKRFLDSHINSRSTLLGESSGFLYFEQQTGMMRSVYAPRVAVSNTTGLVTEVDVSASSTECIGLTFGPAVLQVIPIVTPSTMMPSWAITGSSTSVLDIQALAEANIDLTPIGDDLKVGLIPLVLAIPFSNEKPVDNLNISNPDHVALLEGRYGQEAVEWATTLSESLESDEWYLGSKVLQYLSKDAPECLKQIGPRMSEFCKQANLHSMQPTLSTVHFTSTSDPTKFADLLARMGGQAPSVGSVGHLGGPSVPPSPSALVIEDAGTVKERTLLQNADIKRRIMFCIGTIDEKSKSIVITGFAEENAAMTTVLSGKSASERADNIASIWTTNAKKNRTDPNFKHHSEVRMRDNDNYDPAHATMFIAHNFMSQPLQESISSSSHLISIYAWKKNGKDEVEAFKNEISQQTMELLHGQSEANKTKVRITVSARNCVADLDEASHIIANWRGCLESIFRCTKTSPILYQLAGVAFDFTMDTKTQEWVKRHDLKKIPHKVVHSLDCVIASGVAMSNDFGNKLAGKNDNISGIDSDDFILAAEKFFYILEDMKKKVNFDLPDNEYPLWLEKLYYTGITSNEGVKPTGPLSPSKRTHTGASVSFAEKLRPIVDGLTSVTGVPLGGGTQRGRNTGVGIGLNESWFNANKGGDKRESGGGEFRRKNMNGCYLYHPKKDTPAEALCSEVRAVQCANHAVAGHSCDLTSDKKCPRGLNHEWFHQLPEDLKIKQLDYMDKNRDMVQFNPRAFATVRSLPSNMKHLVATSNTPTSGEN